MSFNLLNVFLVHVFSCLKAKNDRSQVHAVTGKVPRVHRESLMLLKPLNGMRFNVLDMLSEINYIVWNTFFTF